MRTLTLIALLLPMAAFQAHATSATPVRGNESARLSVQITTLEERIRMLEGRLEQAEFESRKLTEQVQILEKDIDLRFNNLEPQEAGEAATETPAEPAAAKEPAPNKDPQVLKAPDSSKFATPREEYNHAFQLLTQTQYDEAGIAFEAFIRRHPKDPLVGNAYYWAGETHYVRQNYIQAADYFRQGYEALPTGPKAGDNLLKLAMSLSAIDRKTESCVVLKQVVAKFASNSVTLKKKAQEERTRLGCK